MNPFRRLRAWLALLLLAAVAASARAQIKVTRVACVGDSITWGARVEDREQNCYPAVLERLLGPGYEVYNFGRSGFTLLKRGDHPYWPVLKEVDAVEPHVVIIKLGTNDTKPRNWRHQEDFEEDLTEMVRHFKALPTEPRVWLCLPAAVVRSNFGITDQVIRRQQPIIRRVAEAEGVPVIDTYSPFVGQADLMDADGVHPNADGAKVLARTVHAALLRRTATFAYVSVAGEKRIAVYRQDAETGELTHTADVAVSGEPGALAVSPDRTLLLASIRSTGQLASFRIDPKTGGLAQVSIVPAGADPAYVATDRTGRYLLAAYYRAGKVTVHDLRRNGRISPEPRQSIATAEKAHTIVADPTNRFVFVPHTGPNRIFQFTFDAETGQLAPNRPASLYTLENTGPRHLAFHPFLEYVYVDNEQGNSVSMLKINRNGTLLRLQTLSTLPRGDIPKNSCSHLELTPAGRFLYVANRGHDSLAGFTVNPITGTLRAIGHAFTEETPRSFNIGPRGQFLYAAGQTSGNLAAYRIDLASGKLERFATYEVGKQPWWVQLVQLDQPGE